METTEEGSLPLLELADDVLRCVFGFLDARSVKHSLLACKNLAALLSLDGPGRLIWKRLVLSGWGDKADICKQLEAEWKTVPLKQCYNSNRIINRYHEFMESLSDPSGVILKNLGRFETDILLRVFGEREPDVSIPEAEEKMDMEQKENKTDLNWSKIAQFRHSDIEKGPSGILDLGSCWTSIGLGNQEEPSIQYPSIAVRRPETVDGYILGAALRNELGNADVPEIYTPIDNANNVGDFRNTHYMFTYALTHLRDNEESLESKLPRQVLIVDDLRSMPRMERVRKQMTNLLFGLHDQVDSVAFGTQQFLSLLPSGSTTGIALHVGFHKTVAATFVEGRCKNLHNLDERDTGGRLCSDMLLRGIYAGNGYIDSMLTAYFAIPDAKDQLCFVSEDIDAAIRNTRCLDETECYKLPDGSTINIGKERFLSPEILFQPELMGFNDRSLAIPTVIPAAIINSGFDDDTAKAVLQNIVLSGRSAYFSGFRPRMELEIKKLMSPEHEDSVSVQPVVRDAAWVGGSILSELSFFHEFCISRKEFDEFGSSIVTRKIDFY